MIQFQTRETTRRDHQVTSAKEITGVIREVGAARLRPSFIEGRNALKASFYAIGQSEGSLQVWHHFEMDDLGQDFHRMPGSFARIMCEVEASAPELVLNGWRLRGFKELVKSIWDIKSSMRFLDRKGRRQGLSLAEYGWYQTGQQMPSVWAVLIDYIRNIRQ